MSPIRMRTVVDRVIHVQNKRANAAGSLEGYVLTEGVHVPYSMNAELARQDPALVREMVAAAKALAKCSACRKCPGLEGKLCPYGGPFALALARRAG
jgi:hypothetical protein